MGGGGGGGGKGVQKGLVKNMSGSFRFFKMWLYIEP